MTKSKCDSTKKQRKRKRIREDLNRAHDIRKFEINLYWKRTTYSWTLIAAAFIAFFSIQASEDLGRITKQVLSFVVANLGFVFSLGWVYTNQGSKYWQQVWETQVDRLEACLCEELYRLELDRIEDKNESRLIRSGRYSVSKINQIISWYVAVVWVGLGVWPLVQIALELFCCDLKDWCLWISSLVLPIPFLFLTAWITKQIICKAKTNGKGDYCYEYRSATRTPCLKK